jgi:hypothetical protein
MRGGEQTSDTMCRENAILHPRPHECGEGDHSKHGGGGRLSRRSQERQAKARAARQPDVAKLGRQRVAGTIQGGCHGRDAIAGTVVHPTVKQMSSFSNLYGAATPTAHGAGNEAWGAWRSAGALTVLSGGDCVASGHRLSTSCRVGSDLSAKGPRRSENEHRPYLHVDTRTAVARADVQRGFRDDGLNFCSIALEANGRRVACA